MTMTIHTMMADEVAKEIDREIVPMATSDWDALIAQAQAIAAKLADAFRPIVQALLCLMEHLLANPETRAWILRLADRARYAPGQRKKKPRGKRAKTQSAEAWALFFARRAALKRHNAQLLGAA